MRDSFFHRPFSIALFPAFALLLAGCANHTTGIPTLEPVGEYSLVDDAPEGLSGIAWCGGDDYALAEDSGGRIHTAKIGVDRVSGAITNCVFTDVQTIPGLVDAEGIAYDKRTNRLYVSDENSAEIIAVQNGTASLPVYAAGFRSHIRPNKSLEALAYDMTHYDWERGDSTLWTANEDALKCDGPVSSSTNAALVRITAIPTYHKVFRLTPFWFYQLDAAKGGPIPGAGPGVPFNGLVGLAALGNGKLLVLERSCGLVPGEDGGAPALITSSLYFVDTSRTEPHSHTPLKKTLLWRQGFPFSNYEGITLGPKLADGSRAVILVADGDVSRATVHGVTLSLQWKKALFALRLVE